MAKKTKAETKTLSQIVAAAIKKNQQHNDELVGDIFDAVLDDIYTLIKAEIRTQLGGRSCQPGCSVVRTKNTTQSSTPIPVATPIR